MSNDGSGETELMCKLILAFAAYQCDICRNQNALFWSVYLYDNDFSFMIKEIAYINWPGFMVSAQVMFNPASLATETNKNIEILHQQSSIVKYFWKEITKVLINIRFSHDEVENSSMTYEKIFLAKCFFSKQGHLTCAVSV